MILMVSISCVRNMFSLVMMSSRTLVCANLCLVEFSSLLLGVFLWSVVMICNESVLFCSTV